MAMTLEGKEHWTVKAARLGLAVAALSSQVGGAACGRKNPDVSPSPTTSSEITPVITPPVSLEPMIAETPVPGETLAPIETASLPVWSAPTLEQMLVEGRGGPLPENIAQYKFEEVIPNGLARIGIEGTAVNFSNNGLADPNYRWAPLVVDSGGLVIWVYDPVIGQKEWPVGLDPLLDTAGNTYYSLRTQGLEYKTIPDSKGAAIVWGGTVDGVSGKHLAILAKDPIALPDGRQIYSSYWDRTAQRWFSTPGLAEIMPTPTPEATVTAESFIRSLEKDGIIFPDRLSSESESGFLRGVYLSESVMEKTGVESLNISPEKMDKIGRVFLGILAWAQRNKNPEYQFLQPVITDELFTEGFWKLIEDNEIKTPVEAMPFGSSESYPVSGIKIYALKLSEYDSLVETYNKLSGESGDILYLGEKMTTYRPENYKIKTLYFLDKKGTLVCIFASNLVKIDPRNGEIISQSLESYQEPKSSKATFVDFNEDTFYSLGMMMSMKFNTVPPASYRFSHDGLFERLLGCEKYSEYRPADCSQAAQEIFDFSK